MKSTETTAGRPQSLAAWLSYQEQQHPQEIALGLERVAAVLSRLSLENLDRCTVITVAGTNGKGSCIAYLESALQTLGCTTAAYTSPHLHRYHERLRINTDELTDEAWCQAFSAVEDARGHTPLTYFEFGTLAAFYLADHAQVEYWLLEVGLGGRLDAVNVLDADIAIVTSVGTDHAAWLGDTREAIGREKAGVFRAGRPAICGDHKPPHSLQQAAAKSGAQPLYINQDFYIERPEADNWEWAWMQRDGICLNELPPLAMAGAGQYDNAACALMALVSLQRWSNSALIQAAQHMVHTKLSARIEYEPLQLPQGLVMRILDVAHNVESAEVLAAELYEWRKSQGSEVSIHAVFSALQDKPVREMAKVLASCIHAWYVGPLASVERGMDPANLAENMQEIHILKVYESLKMAYDAAEKSVKAGDAILVFGSFHTIAEIVEYSHE